MKRAVFALLPLCAGVAQAADTWTLYSGTSIVQPRIDYPSQLTCDTAAAAQVVREPTNFFCKSTATEQKTVGNVTVSTIITSSSKTARVPMGPAINVALLVPPAAGKDFLDIRAPSPEAINPSDSGDFRNTCDFARMAFDDPIVFPRQPGKSHLHTFFGNVSVDANTTVANVMAGKASTCAGGLANLSAYWVPSMIDTRDARPLKPMAFVVYYKQAYVILDASRIQAPPTGLRIIAGSAANADPAGAKATRYICYGPAGENPGWAASITAAVAKGTCLPGGELVMEVSFPQCWDGRNLDSPDHASHMSGFVQDQTPPFATHCPSTHPAVLPAISYNVHYAVTEAGAVARWRLSSDMYDPKLPAGLSGHADYFIGWQEEPKAAWIKNCVQARMDCHANNLGDGRRLW